MTALVDRYFLIKEGTGTYQGRVTACVQDGYYLCQFYSWLDGSPTSEKLAHITVMTSWEFYSDAVAWRSAGGGA